METQTDFKQTALSTCEQARLIQIIDQPSYDVAAEAFKGACDLEKKIVAHYKPLKESAWETHKKITAAEHTVLDPVQAAKGILSRTIGAWEAEQRRKEEEERRRLEAEEMARQEEEILAEAIAVEQMGASKEEVESVLETPKALPKTQPQPAYTRASGLGVRTYYSAEQKAGGLLELVKAAAANPAAYLGYLTANQSAANALAGAQKEAFNLPGFKLKKETKAAGRGR